ncbi:YidB family protein [Advenella kashmirensis]
MGILDAVNAVLGGGKKPAEQPQSEQTQEGQVASGQAPADQAPAAQQEDMGGLGGLGGLGNGINLGALSALLPVILSVINNQQGGLGGLAEKFQRGGLGDIFNSWVNQGENREISPQQVDTALGADTVDSIAQQSGQPREDILGTLSGILPQVVDKSTPEGQIPADGQARGENEVLNSLSSLFK